MRNRSRQLISIAAAVAAVGALVVSQATGARSCAASEGRVLVVTKTARITSVRGDGFRTWFACLDRRGRRVALGVHDPSGQSQLGRPTLAGSFAAFERFRPSTRTTGTSAIVVDVAARRRATMFVPGDITGMVLSSRGDLIATNDQAVLHLRRGRPVATLDSGDIAPNSLALSRDGRYAYWLNAGQPRVYELPR